MITLRNLFANKNKNRKDHIAITRAVSYSAAKFLDESLGRQPHPGAHLPVATNSFDPTRSSDWTGSCSRGYAQWRGLISQGLRQFGSGSV